MENTLETGFVLSTNSVKMTMAENLQFSIFCQNCLQNHKSGIWGDLEIEDKESNDFALENNKRILSAYKFPPEIKIKNEVKIWILTEHDRSVTTILFPSEY